jgi:hypothetical protein
MQPTSVIMIHRFKLHASKNALVCQILKRNGYAFSAKVFFSSLFWFRLVKLMVMTIFFGKKTKMNFKKIKREIFLEWLCLWSFSDQEGKYNADYGDCDDYCCSNA